MRPSTPVDLFLASYYLPLSLLWAGLWTKVAFHYGRASFDTWRINNASWKIIFCDIFDPLMYAVVDFLCRSDFLCRKLRLEKRMTETGVIPTNSPGNILRFAIFVGSMTPISFGLAFAFQPVWNEPLWKLVIAMTFMSTSILGALGHLFLAHRGNPRRWSSVIVYSMAWIIIAPPCLLFWRTLP